MMKKLLLMILILVFPAGCLPTSVIDDILMIEAEGYDYLGDGKVYGTITMPSYVQSGNPQGGGSGIPATASMMRSAQGVTLDGKSLQEQFQPKGQRPLKVGKLRVVLIDKELAEHGIANLLTFRNRDPDVGMNIRLAVVDGSTNKLLTGAYQTEIPVSRYIVDMINQNEEQNFPTSNLHEILYSYYGAYMDPFMPIIKKAGRHLEIEGIALFKNGQYVMSIPERDAIIFKMIYENFNQGIYDYQLPGNKHVTLRNVNSSVSYEVRNGNGSAPEIKAKVKIVTQIRQATSQTINKHENDKLIRTIEKEMENRAEQMVARFQKKGVDPLRLGDTVRSFTRHFHGDSWPDRYPNAHFQCRINVKITQTGISQ